MRKSKQEIEELIKDKKCEEIDTWKSLLVCLLMINVPLWIVFLIFEVII